MDMSAASNESGERQGRSSRVLALSSQVVRGHVGLSAAVPVLQRLGHEVGAMPTVLLSHHPGRGPIAGRAVDPADLANIVDVLEASGWLAGVDAVLTGYLPSAEHVAVATDTIERVRRSRRQAFIVVDPILGDDPKGLYIATDAAEAIRDRLLPLADVATPNRMELAYLTGRQVTGVDTAARALECLASGGGLAPSLPAGDAEIANVLSAGPALAVTRVARRAHVAHGTGDLMTALWLGHVLAGCSLGKALGLATAGVDAVLQGSEGADELALTPALARLDTLLPWEVQNKGLQTGLTKS